MSLPPPPPPVLEYFLELSPIPNGSIKSKLEFVEKPKNVVVKKQKAFIAKGLLLCGLSSCLMAVWKRDGAARIQAIQAVRLSYHLTRGLCAQRQLEREVR